MGMKALISVADKTGVVALARKLVASGFEILSTGGTAQELIRHSLPVTLVEQYTGSPELLHGRVKTLHPKIHGGILARAQDAEELAQHGIDPISIVVVNLYPFGATVQNGSAFDEAIEQIDIGGVTLLRAAAKNHGAVTVVCDSQDYERVAGELPNISDTLRSSLAVKAFRHTAQYDAMIAQYLGAEIGKEQTLALLLAPGRQLRYGENPHQEAVFYPDGTCGIGNAEQLHGKQLSYNNYLDGDAALAVVHELRAQPAVAVVKHTNPCGIATGETLRQALEAAWSGDVVSAFGSVIAFSREVDLATAEFLKDKFVEMVIAPGYAEDALAILVQKSKQLRVMRSGNMDFLATTWYRQVSGGILAQSPDDTLAAHWECVTTVEFPEEKKPLALFTLTACKHTKSNAVILGVEYAPGYFKVLGMGAGQPNRVDALRKLAVTKAQENMRRDGRDEMSSCVLASDAFFPFNDTVREAAKLGITHIVQPGGSIRDKEVINACNELGVAMVFTGTRHFKH